MSRFLILILCGSFSVLHAQTRLLLHSEADGAALQAIRAFPDQYTSPEAALQSLPQLIYQLQKTGYWAASADSTMITDTVVEVWLWLGDYYGKAIIEPDSTASILLNDFRFNRRNEYDIHAFDTLKHQLLLHLSNKGYPFAAIRIDSLQQRDHQYVALLVLDPGPLYTIDSIANHGNAVINERFLARHLQMPKGSVYREEDFGNISKKLAEIDFLQEKSPHQITMTGTGAILNLFLDERKNSQFNFLVGFLPATDQTVRQKLQVTGEANILLKNELGGGEVIGVNWQQLQVKSPRLNILFEQPYILGSAFGTDFNFNLFKKDSSFVNINFNIGLRYAMGRNQTGSVFLQQTISNMLTIDTVRIKQTRQLPDQLDIRSTNIGITYTLNRTDYVLNPRKGRWLNVIASAGIKKINRNEIIQKLHADGIDFTTLYDSIRLESYQYRLQTIFDQFIPIGKVATLKMSFKGGLYQSPEIFRNELFQIGGYRLMRGFDEESLYVSEYGVLTAEYRYLIGRNAYLFGFSDAGWIGSRTYYGKMNDRLLSAGAGIHLETKAGLIQLALAVGKREGQSFDFRQAKIHIGYVNYF